jgi:hypothetical protein
VSLEATAVTVTWASPQGVLGTYTWTVPPETATVVWGTVLPTWYHPTPLWLTVGTGTETQQARWIVETVVPEPTSVVLCGIGLVLLGIGRVARAGRPGRWRR